MKPDSIEQARDLVDALSRFCKSIEEIATLRSDADHGQPDQPDLPGTALSADPKAQLLALTELVRHALHVLDKILTEAEPACMTRNS
jgi:hypothetical protein